MLIDESSRFDFAPGVWMVNMYRFMKWPVNEMNRPTRNERSTIMIWSIAECNYGLSNRPMTTIAIQLVVYHVYYQVPGGCPEKLRTIELWLYEPYDNEDPPNPHCTLNRHATRGNRAVWLIDLILFNSKHLVYEFGMGNLYPDPKHHVRDAMEPIKGAKCRPRENLDEEYLLVRASIEWRWHGAHRW